MSNFQYNIKIQGSGNLAEIIVSLKKIEDIIWNTGKYEEQDLDDFFYEDETLVAEVDKDE